ASVHAGDCPVNRAFALALLLGVGLVVRPAPREPHRHLVEIRDMAFHPATLVLAVGDTVVWINRDMLPHTATASDTTRLDTGELLRDGRAWFVADRVGEVAYLCRLHPVMQGTLRIR
ncbi:MAG TPA: hypothetical protein VD793_08395, partial [Gemmatimonadales bacterium]|nr:hypothetical protein [Gemmatimonadales bacterium]